MKHSFPPRQYYTYQMYRRSNYQVAERYLHDYEAGHLFRAVNRYAPTEVLGDKRLFHECVIVLISPSELFGVAVGRCQNVTHPWTNQ